MPPHVPAAVLLMLGVLMTPAAAMAQAADFFVPQFIGTAPPGNLLNSILNIINSLLVIVAIAAVVYIIISGVRYFSSQGDEDAARQAKLALIYGVIGIIIITLSIVIIRFFQSQVA